MLMNNLANISAIYPRSPMVNMSRAESFNEFTDNKQAMRKLPQKQIGTNF
jgi:hypothetical protein